MTWRAISGRPYAGLVFYFAVGVGEDGDEEVEQDEDHQHGERDVVHDAASQGHTHVSPATSSTRVSNHFVLKLSGIL